MLVLLPVLLVRLGPLLLVMALVLVLRTVAITDARQPNCKRVGHARRHTSTSTSTVTGASSTIALVVQDHRQCQWTRQELAEHKRGDVNFLLLLVLLMHQVILNLILLQFLVVPVIERVASQCRAVHGSH